MFVWVRGNFFSVRRSYWTTRSTRFSCNLPSRIIVKCTVFITSINRRSRRKLFTSPYECAVLQKVEIGDVLHGRENITKVTYCDLLDAGITPVNNTAFRQAHPPTAVAGTSVASPSDFVVRSVGLRTADCEPFLCVACSSQVSRSAAVWAGFDAQAIKDGIFRPDASADVWATYLFFTFRVA